MGKGCKGFLEKKKMIVRFIAFHRGRSRYGICHLKTIFPPPGLERFVLKKRVEI